MKNSVETLSILVNKDKNEISYYLIKKCIYSNFEIANFISIAQPVNFILYVYIKH
jgi:hypothetical protein